jgi:hypothetical protein
MRRQNTQLTFWDRLAERTVPVQNHLLVLGLDQVVDDMRRRRIAPGIAEPLVTRQTLPLSTPLGGTIVRYTDLHDALRIV